MEETDLLGTYSTYQQHYNHVIQENELKYTMKGYEYLENQVEGVTDSLSNQESSDGVQNVDEVEIISNIDQGDLQMSEQLLTGTPINIASNVY